jgi:hypothetical protein
METIFIQIASYKDPELINTIEDCLQKSSFPERLRFGICWQKTEAERISPYDEDGRFRIHAVDWRESRGVGWARNICNGLWRSEDFTLQIDSHHRFAEGWDVTLIDQWRQCRHPKAVLSGYPPKFEYIEDGKIFFAKLSPRTMIVKEFFAGFVPIFKSGAIPNSDKIQSPYKGSFISAGFLFTIGKVCEEVPYNKEVYFSGEEILHSLRLFTHGYRVFHPHKWVTWHLYQRLTSEKHWSDYANDKELNVKYKEIRAASMDILKQTLSGNRKYAGLLGTTSTLEDFENYCGIKFKSRVLHPKMMAGEQPPFESANGWEDSVSPLKEWDVHFDIHTGDISECDDYDFWYFALHDRNCMELHRDDIRNKGGMVSKEAVKTYTKKVFLREKPEKYIIWPHSVSKGWIKRLVYDIPANCVTLTLA